jgi:hypothetical protein
MERVGFRTDRHEECSYRHSENAWNN